MGDVKTASITEEVHVLEHCVINLSTQGGGSGGATPPVLPAASNLSALRLVSKVGNNYAYSDPNSADSVWAIAGLAVFSVNTGVSFSPIRDTFFSDSNWNWLKGLPIFLGANGTLTQTAPTTGYLVTVAKVLDPQTIFIQIEEPIAL